MTLKKKKTPESQVNTEINAEKLSQLEKVAARIEKMRLGDYVTMMNRPMRIIWTNLLVGISRGVGLTLGATLVIAIIFKIISALISMNIPYLTDMLQDVVQIVKTTPAMDKFHNNIEMVEAADGSVKATVVVDK